MSDLTTVQISKEASKKLGRVARVHKRSKSKQAEHMIETAYSEIVRVEELPHPEDAEAVPVVVVQ